MSEDRTTEIYHGPNMYLRGLYSIEDLKRIIETAERIDEVNKQLAKEAAPEFKTMDETASTPDDTWSKVYKSRDIE
jgi:hypothetical protein